MNQPRFKVGDKVRILPHPHGKCAFQDCTYWTKEMDKYFGKEYQVLTVFYSYKINYRLDTSLYVFSDCMVEAVNKGKEVKYTMAKNISEIEFRREDGDQILSLSIDKEVEELFEDNDTETSEKYVDTDGDGLEYYALNKNLSKMVEKYQRKTGNSISLEKYGTELFWDGHKPNLSILRTVNLKKGAEVVVNDLITEEEVEDWSSSLAKFLEFLYQEYVDDTPLRVKVVLEK